MSAMQNTDRGVVWVAGVNASAGLGAAVARRFARDGHVVAVSGRTAPRLEQVAQEIRAAGGQAHVVPFDVTDEAALAAAAKQVAQLGPLEVGVYNAANMVAAPSLELKSSDFEQSWRVTTLGGFLFGREVLRALLPQGHGTLLYTGATGSLKGRPPFLAFAAAKAALRSISQTLAREFGPQGIHVAHVVVDGAIDGERVRSRMPERVAKLGPDGLLAPDAIAEVYLHLHQQPRSAWTQELDLRPYKETF